jgi:hypothetical protein
MRIQRSSVACLAGKDMYAASERAKRVLYDFFEYGSRARLRVPLGCYGSVSIYHSNQLQSIRVAHRSDLLKQPS